MKQLLIIGMAGLLQTSLAVAASTCTPEHAAMGHCPMDKPAEPVKPAASTCTAEHAAMGHCTMDKPAQPAKPAASTCTAEHAAMGHCTMDKPAQPAKPVAQTTNTCLPEHEALGHCKSGPSIPVSDGSASTHIPMPFHGAMDMEDDPLLSKVTIDRFELRKSKDDDHTPFILEADAWIGKDINKLVFKTDLEVVDGELEEGELQVLYNRAIHPYWDMQAGIRHDFKPVKQDWFALGVSGTAPYFTDTTATLFIGERGQTAARLSAEKEFMLTQRTALVTEAGLNLRGKADPVSHTGAGMTDMSVSLRLQHELKREFAPYIGVNWSRQLGETADIAKAQGEKSSKTEIMLGIHAWF